MEEIIKAIIKEQSMIIGEELATQMAISSGVIEISGNNGFVINEKDQSVALDKIMNSYKKIFGQSSVEVCQRVIKKFN